jgi:hypothetical protein
VPHLNDFKGWALFCDSDFLWNCNPEELLEYVKRDLQGYSEKAVYCVQHDYQPTEDYKMDGRIQTKYPRKNWSSLMLFNCSHPDVQKLTVSAVNKESPAWLHRMQWVSDDKLIGELPHSYNYLVDHYHDEAMPKVIHYTDGGPWHPGYEHCEFANNWWKYVTSVERMRVEMEREELREAMSERMNE